MSDNCQTERCVRCGRGWDELVHGRGCALALRPSPAVKALVAIAQTFLDNYRARRRADAEAGRPRQGAFIYDELKEALAAVEREIGDQFADASKKDGEP